MDDQKLKEFFVFDEADLNANRQGRLTEKQSQYLADDRRYTRIVGWGCSALFFVTALVIPLATIAAYIKSGRPFDESAMRDLGPNIGTAALFVLLALVMLFWMRRRTAAGAAPVLKSIRGPINIVAVERRHDLEHPVYIVHELHIGEISFDVKKDLAGLMQQGDDYAIYYTENPNGTGRLIQSVERL